ncbi:male sterility protein-domain-containing protein [Umbelopsis sp. AD052]|nr:male sterility protein-domain-containing protein [Umbelopsis sp. AD052]
MSASPDLSTTPTITVEEPEATNERELLPSPHDSLSPSHTELGTETELDTEADQVKEDSYEAPTVEDIPENTSAGTEDTAIALSTVDEVDDSQRALVNESPLSSSMADFYRGKSVLLTGSTGFLGKSILWKLLDSFGAEIDKIYLLIRYGNNKRKIGGPHERLQSEILNNPAFTSLRRKIGPNKFDAIITTKVIPVACDLISPELSISPEDRDSIISNVNVVIHCAASMDHDERLDLSLETNTLGTLRLMDLADDCEKMQAFVHVSSAYVNSNLPDGEVQELVYPAELDDPETLLKEIVSLELMDIPKMTQRILENYPNTHLFTKALTEQLILKRADINRADEAQGGKSQWPIAIVRPTQLGAGTTEPLAGWADGLTGANATILLSGRGFQILQPNQGDSIADIVPVDYVTRIILGVASKIQVPGIEFLLPYAYGNRNSGEQQEIFPYIYQVTAAPLNPVNWREVYDGIQEYWMRTTSVVLPKSQDYFVSNKAMFKARFFMKYQLSNSFSHVANAIVTGDNKSLNTIAKMTGFATKLVEANQPFIKRTWAFSNGNLWEIQRHLASETSLSIDAFGEMDWHSYIEHYNHGMHLYVAQESQGLRSISAPPGWDCATHTKMIGFQSLAIDKQVESILFSSTDIEKRSQRMLAQVILSLESTDRPRDKRMNDEWVADFDTSLDDWCHDDSEVLKDGTTISERGKELGRWRAHIGDNDDIVKVIVLNDSRVGNSIKQITESSGVPQQTVVGEATKLFLRMKERTQLAYVWFAGHFLHHLLQKLFENVHIREADVTILKRAIAGKKVVYVPTSKSLVDNLIVWYLTLRYKLPVPAIACDEALGLLGPISDVLRIMGTFFIKRNPESRSPLNNAVTAAYAQVMLREHGALSFMLEKARSRSGKFQKAYDDGLVGMVLEAALEKNQENTKAELSPTSPLTPIPSERILDQDVAFVPINIVYESVPELSVLIDQVLDQHPTTNTNTLSVPLLVTKPSAALAGRHKESDHHHNTGKYGRVFVNIGECVSVQEIAENAKVQKSAAFDTSKGLSSLSERVVKAIQRGQRESVAISPVSLVAAILLYGRANNGISLGRVKDHMEWIRTELKKRDVYVDWQDGEDIESVIFYSLRLLDGHKNIIIEDKRVSDKSIIRVVDHADNVLAVSYSANQLLDYLLPDSLFSIVYLSFSSKTVPQQKLLERFQFLTKLFRLEFDFTWDDEQMFDQLLKRFQDNDIITRVEGQNDVYNRAVNSQNEEAEHEKICLLASLLYPTLDSYWITICSLSALEDLPYIPRKLAPILTQWIATHLISGRRTSYREVLSTEVSGYAVDAFLALGYINQVHCKEKLTPDAQILLLELGIVTNEDLLTAATIEQDFREDNVSEIENLPISESQQETLKAEKKELSDIAAKVERLSKISQLCNDIEILRFDAASHSENYHQNAQVFLKCQRQIKSILRADQSYAAQHGVPLSKEEDDMIQLVYALKMSSPSGGQSKQTRRISEAYNLHP